MRHLRRDRGLDPTPLTTYYDRDGSEAADAENLEAAWQAAAPLGSIARAARLALDDESGQVLGDDFPHLATLLAELETMASWAAARDARIRLSFTLG